MFSKLLITADQLPARTIHRLMARLSTPQDFKPLWRLGIFGICALIALGGGLLLVSDQLSHLLFAIGIVVCAVFIAAWAGYISWLCLIVVTHKSSILDAVHSVQKGVMLTGTDKASYFSNNYLQKTFSGSADGLEKEPLRHEALLQSIENSLISQKSKEEFWRLQESATRGTSDHGGVACRTTSGEVTLWRILIYPLLHAPGHAIWVFDLYEGVEEISEDAIDLYASLSTFEHVFQDAPLGVVLLNPEARVVAANHFFKERLYPEDSQTLPFFELFQSSNHSKIQVLLDKIKGGENASMPIEVTLTNEKTASIYLSRLEEETSDGTTQLIGLIVYCVDTTEQNLLQLQLMQAQKMQAMGQLAGGIAHDFNNLLTAIIGFCDLLLQRHSPSDQSFTDIMQIKQNSNRAANLVRQLLAYSRQQTLKPQVLRVEDNLAELSVLLKRLVGVNIDLDVIHGRDLGLVKVDRGQLEQVIINLVVNARDAIQGRGQITIKTSPAVYTKSKKQRHELISSGAYVQIDVIDTGVGVSEENLDRIFDPFFSTKALGQGTGLGLSTVYGIVKQTGGFITVESREGHGATFSVLLPEYKPEEGERFIHQKATHRSLGDLTGMGTILLVEDEDPVRLFGARALRDKGYQVIEAQNGEEALGLIHSMGEKGVKHIDLVVTDVVMPQMDGPTLIKHVHDIFPEMKVIYISGYAEDSFRQKVDEEGDIHFLPKPFSLKDLALKVKEVLSGLDPAEENPFADTVSPLKPSL